VEPVYYLKAAAIFLVFAPLFVAERIHRAAPAPRLSTRVLKNLGLWFVIAAASPFIVAPVTALGANALLWERSPAMTVGVIGVCILIIDLILLDLWTYWLHRAYHRIPLLWRLHEVHHRDAFLDTTSAVRFHLGEVVLSAFLRLAPIMLFSIPLTTVILFEAILLASALFHHSNLRLPQSFERLLSRFIVTPSIHWVHHHAVRADTDSNYGSLLIVWDRLFRSRSRTERSYDMKIGAEGIEELSFLGLLLAPFVRKTS